ncbi:hypothetical protein TNCV_3326391 [Trichonephila clavipes]|nr:hypothetical protein TNCV_3326391 [Trichonephila clavipes]
MCDSLGFTWGTQGLRGAQFENRWLRVTSSSTHPPINGGGFESYFCSYFAACLTFGLCHRRYYGNGGAVASDTAFFQEMSNKLCQKNKAQPPTNVFSKMYRCFRTYQFYPDSSQHQDVIAIPMAR